MIMDINEDIMDDRIELIKYYNELVIVPIKKECNLHIYK